MTKEEMAYITKEATERSEWFTVRQKVSFLEGFMVELTLIQHSPTAGPIILGHWKQQ